MKSGFSIRIFAVMVMCAMLSGAFAGALVTNEASEVSAATKITEAKAKRIAMRSAGTSSSKVLGMDVTKTYKNGKNVYQVYFYAHKSGRVYTHYAFTISARTGDVIKKNSKDYTVITKSKAKDKALDDEDFDRDDVDDLECDDLDEEDGKLVYEVSFTGEGSKEYNYLTGSYYYDEYDYEYTINAVTGHIIDSDTDDD